MFYIATSKCKWNNTIKTTPFLTVCKELATFCLCYCLWHRQYKNLRPTDLFNPKSENFCSKWAVLWWQTELMKKPQSFRVSDSNLEGPVLKWRAGCRAWEKCLCAGCTCRILLADIHAEGKQGVSHAAICRLCTSKHPLPCRNARLEGHSIWVPAVKNWNDEPCTETSTSRSLSLHS